jgi:hypothetical protein
MRLPRVIHIDDIRPTGEERNFEELNKYFLELKSIIDSEGIPLQVGTENCFNWKIKHGTCEECSSYVGCLKALILVNCISCLEEGISLRKMGSIEKFLATAQTIIEVIQCTLKATTKEELEGLYSKLYSYFKSIHL